MHDGKKAEVEIKKDFAQNSDSNDEELAREMRRRERIAQMKREKERQMRRRKVLKYVVPIVAWVLACALISTVIIAVIRGISATRQAKDGVETRKELTEKTQKETKSWWMKKKSAEDEKTPEEQEGLSEEGEDILDEPTSPPTAIKSGMPEAWPWEHTEITTDRMPVNSTPMGGTEGEGANPTEDANLTGNNSAGSENISGEDIGVKTPAQERYSAHTTAQTAEPPEEVDSGNVVFIDLSSGDILAQRGYAEVIVPASMTKVLTVLVAAEHVTDLDATFTMTVDITDYSYFHDCSSVGFEVGEVVTLRDLFYGTVLPSGADAAVALATYVAGSHEAFVDMMNAKVEELGLSATAHFTNCVGLYDEEHHCSVYDMAMIMQAAIHNDICREVLHARRYTTSATEQHPDGIEISNWFLRKIEDKDTGGEIVCGKTGFVNQSKNCAVSYGVDAAGKEYICATAGAHSSWRCIYDHVAIYKAYAQSADG